MSGLYHIWTTNCYGDIIVLKVRPENLVSDILRAHNTKTGRDLTKLLYKGNTLNNKDKIGSYPDNTPMICE